MNKANRQDRQTKRELDRQCESLVLLKCPLLTRHFNFLYIKIPLINYQAFKIWWFFKTLVPTRIHNLTYLMQFWKTRQYNFPPKINLHLTNDFDPCPKSCQPQAPNSCICCIRSMQNAVVTRNRTPGHTFIAERFTAGVRIEFWNI